jgi:hypothetical protein
MNKKQRIALLLVLITSLVISGCGPGQLFGPTITPTPTQTLSPTSTQTPTQTMTPTPTQTMTPTQAATLTPAVTVDPDCGSIPGNNLSLSQAIIGSWKNGDVIVWVFCRSGKLIEKNIADKTEEVKIYIKWHYFNN